MPLCLGASASVRARQMPQSARSATEFHTFWPDSFQPPSTRSALVRSEARSEPAPGSENSWHQTRSPSSDGFTNRSCCSAVPASRIVRHRPAGDHDVRAGDAGPGELVVDDDLGHGVGSEAVRRRPVRRQVPVLDHRRPELLGRQRGESLGLGPHVVADVGVPALQVDVHLAAYAGDGPVGEPLGRGVGALDQRPQAERPAQVEVGVVLVGEADAAEHLDAGLGVVDRAVEAGHRGDVGGERPLVVARRPPSRRRSTRRPTPRP